MRLLEYLYVSFYRLSEFFRENIPGSFLYNRRFGSIMILSILTLLNISSVWMYLNIGPMFTTHLFDFILGLLVVTGLFTLYFERKSRYKIVLEKYKAKSFIGLSLVYSISSIGIFIFLHSRTWFISDWQVYKLRIKYLTTEMKLTDRQNQTTGYNFSYPSSAAAVVFGGHLSAQAAFRLDRKSPAVRPCV